MLLEEEEEEEEEERGRFRYSRANPNSGSFFFAFVPKFPNSLHIFNPNIYQTDTTFPKKHTKCTIQRAPGIHLLNAPMCALTSHFH